MPTTSANVNQNLLNLNSQHFPPDIRSFFPVLLGERTRMLLERMANPAQLCSVTDYIKHSSV